MRPELGGRAGQDGQGGVVGLLGPAVEGGGGRLGGGFGHRSSLHWHWGRAPGRPVTPAGPGVLDILSATPGSGGDRRNSWNSFAWPWSGPATSPI